MICPDGSSSLCIEYLIYSTLVMTEMWPYFDIHLWEAIAVFLSPNLTIFIAFLMGFRKWKQGCRSWILHTYDPSYIPSYQPTFLRYEKENDTTYMV